MGEFVNNNARVKGCYTCYIEGPQHYLLCKCSYLGLPEEAKEVAFLYRKQALALMCKDSEVVLVARRQRLKAHNV
jgi:hypothetical protein